MRPKLLDLFCGAGGCSVGYHRAGFDCVGVDIHRQRNYPFEFIQANAIDFLEAGGKGHWDVIHASPPCQAFSVLKNHSTKARHPELIEPIRKLLISTGLPYVIENVVGSPLINPVNLCGSAFGLKLRRHRLFESNVPIVGKPCDHSWQLPFSAAGHWRPGTYVSVCGNCAPIKMAKEAMGIDWMNRHELSQAIPPAYTEYVGRQIIHRLTPVKGR